MSELLAHLRGSAVLLCVLLGPTISSAQEEDWFLKPVFTLAAADLHTIDVRTLLNAACPGKAYFHGGKNKRELGCSTCPRGSDFYIDRNIMSQTLDAVTFGHFTAADAEDVILSMSGCESHAHFFGGSHLLTRIAGNWKRVVYTSGTITDQYNKLTTESGREILVCSRYFEIRGYVDRHLFALDFATPAKPRITELLTVANGLRSCGQYGDHANLPIPQGIIESVALHTSEDGLSPGITIIARTGKIQRSDAQYKACEAWSGGKRWNNPPPVRTPRYRIDYLLQGSRLILSRDSTGSFRHFPN